VTVGLALSILMHAALLGYALLAIGQAAPREPKDPVEAIIADVISESDLNRMRKGVREAKLDAAQPKDVKDPDQAEKQPERPRPVVAQPPPAAEPPPPPPPPEPAAAETPPPPPPSAVAKVEPPPKADPPKPEPDKLALAQKLDELALKKAEEEKAQQEAEAKAKAEAEAKAAEDKRKEEEKKLAEEKRKAEEKKKAEEKRKRELAEAKRKAAEKKKADEKRKQELAKKQFDANRLSALLDKTPDPKQAAAANDAPDHATDAKGPVRGDTHGRDNTISANEASFLAGLMRQAVSRCWNINAGLDGIQQMVVKVEIRLTPDGRLSSPPRVVNSSTSPVFRDAADSAVRALVQCEPYVLPPDKYEGGWEHMILTFDPARMF
jgi:colicin import membrane protein